MRDVETSLEQLRARVADLKAQLVRPATTPNLIVPDIAEFMMSSDYLGMDMIYPAQATYLKLMFMQDTLLTSDDIARLDGWGQGWVVAKVSDPRDFPNGVHYEGTQGIAPDWRERMAVNKAAGRPWFREHVPVWGRRAGKNRVGAIAAAYVTWNILALGDPQAHFGIAPEKVLSGLVFGPNFTQARAQQWLDIVQVIVQAPCFAPFVQDIGASRLVLATPADLDRPGRHLAGTIEIVAKETTALAGRGPAAFMEFFDELAHISAATAKVSADAVYEAATPAIDQFGPYGFIYESSSPWQMVGSFYRNFRKGLQVDPSTKAATHPHILVSQLASWDPYQDWEHAHHLPVAPASTTVNAHRTDDGQVRTFNPLSRAQASYDDLMRQLEEDDPVRFGVERRAQWATVTDAFLNPVHVHDMFRPEHRFRSEGAHNIDYHIHVDPSTRHDNYVWVIAHREPDDDRGLKVMRIDAVRVFDPKTFPGHEIDHLQMLQLMLDDIRAFHPVEVTFDQHQSAQMMQLIRTRLRSHNLFRTPSIHEVTATGPANREAASIFQHALAMRQIQCPPHELLQQESLFLQELAGGRIDHPTTGPVQSNDTVTCVMFLAVRILSDDPGGLFQHLSNTVLGGMPGPSWGRPQSDPNISEAMRGGGSRRRPRVGERKYPGGPRRLPGDLY